MRLSNRPTPRTYTFSELPKLKGDKMTVKSMLEHPDYNPSTWVNATFCEFESQNQPLYGVFYGSLTHPMFRTYKGKVAAMQSALDLEWWRVNSGAKRKAFLWVHTYEYILRVQRGYRIGNGLGAEENVTKFPAWLSQETIALKYMVDIDPPTEPVFKVWRERVSDKTLTLPKAGTELTYHDNAPQAVHS